MKILNNSLFCAVFLLLASVAGAYTPGGWVASRYVNPAAENAHPFMCNATKYVSDVALAPYHGCEVLPMQYGPGGTEGNIIVAHHGWAQDEQGAQTPQKTYFIELPDGALYRLVDSTILTSPRMTKYFRDGLGIVGRGKTNIGLDKFTQLNVKNYGNTFCLQYHLKHPFKGVAGWCQGDTLVGGEIGYLKGAMTFTRAALAAQSYIYDNNVPITGSKLLGAQTMSALNIDQNGWYYYAFATPAKTGVSAAGYVLRVYFNGQVSLREVAQMPTDPNQL